MKYDCGIFPDYGYGYGGGNDELYHLAGADAGKYFRAGAGKRETVSGSAVIAVESFYPSAQDFRADINYQRGL